MSGYALLDIVSVFGEDKWRARERGGERESARERERDRDRGGGQAGGGHF
jgi:hypothetical protein